jgi:hypothetical protein
MRRRTHVRSVVAGSPKQAYGLHPMRAPRRGQMLMS